MTTAVEAAASSGTRRTDAETIAAAPQDERRSWAPRVEPRHALAVRMESAAPDAP